MKRIHVEREVIEFTFVVCNRRIGISVELDQGIYKIPRLAIVGVKYMCTVLVDINTFNLLAIDISPNVPALLNYQNFLTCVLCTISKDCTEIAYI